jgi:hypothetical protein
LWNGNGGYWSSLIIALGVRHFNALALIKISHDKSHFIGGRISCNFWHATKYFWPSSGYKEHWNGLATFQTSTICCPISLVQNFNLFISPSSSNTTENQKK